MRRDSRCCDASRRRKAPPKGASGSGCLICQHDEPLLAASRPRPMPTMRNSRLPSAAVLRCVPHPLLSSTQCDCRFTCFLQATAAPSAPASKRRPPLTLSAPLLARASGTGAARGQRQRCRRLPDIPPPSPTCAPQHPLRAPPCSLFPRPNRTRSTPNCEALCQKCVSAAASCINTPGAPLPAECSAYQTAAAPCISGRRRAYA